MYNASPNWAQCRSILKSIKSKPEADPFTEAVDWKALGLVDYPKVIKTPMDLGKVQKKVWESSAGVWSHLLCSWKLVSMKKQVTLPRMCG